MVEILEMIREFLGDLTGTRALAKKNKVSLLASSVAFYSIFSLLPFFIVSFLGSRYLIEVLGSAPGDTPDEIKQIIESILPGADLEIKNGLLAILRENALSNVFNMIFSGWSAYQLFGVIHYAFEQMSVRGNQRNVFLENFVSLICFLVMAATSTLLLFATTANIAVLKVLFAQYLEGVDLLGMRMIIVGVGGFSVFASITLIYKLMPTQKVSIVCAFRGSVLFVVFFLIGRTFYEAYASYYKLLNAGTFGPFLTFVMVVVWLYFVSRAFLFSAQYAIYLQEKRTLQSR